MSERLATREAAAENKPESMLNSTAALAQIDANETHMTEKILPSTGANRVHLIRYVGQMHQMQIVHSRRKRRTPVHAQRQRTGHGEGEKDRRSPAFLAMQSLRGPSAPANELRRKQTGCLIRRESERELKQ